MYVKKASKMQKCRFETLWFLIKALAEFIAFSKMRCKGNKKNLITQHFMGEMLCWAQCRVKYRCLQKYE